MMEDTRQSQRQARTKSLDQARTRAKQGELSWFNNDLFNGFNIKDNCSMFFREKKAALSLLVKPMKYICNKCTLHQSEAYWGLVLPIIGNGIVLTNNFIKPIKLLDFANY